MPLVSTPILVSDFDGTITLNDFYRLILEQLLPPDAPDFWTMYVEGRISHFEALRRTYLAAPGGEPAIRALLRQMQPDPELKAHVEALRSAGWEVRIASAGCSWYIQEVLHEAGVDLEVLANPGKVEGGRLRMELPQNSPFFRIETGIDKIAVVRHALNQGGPVAYAGDGITDVEPARLVPPHLRFARGVMAESLRRLGEDFRPFRRWSEIAQALLAETSVV
jgi:2,3-diketo-5-methylthio-1-phosphopentane phosphatase